MSAAALLIVDEAGGARWRAIGRGQWSGVQPELSSWGVHANGHHISALMGEEKARAEASQNIVTGSYWYAASPMAAGLEIALVQEKDYLEKMQS